MTATQSKLIYGYYLALGSFLLFTIAQTLFLGSVHVAHGKELQVAEQEKQSVTRELAQLETNYSQEVSLRATQSYLDSHTFVSISKPLVISSTTTVASR